jgi:starch synthase (maltosyl-transferring)
MSGLSTEAPTVRRPTTAPPRVVIEGVRPEIDAGRFPIKRVGGDEVVVEADIFADGHDQLSCRLLCRREDETTWQEIAMTPLGNDRWRGAFPVTAIGRYVYTLEGWVDAFRTWRHGMTAKIAAGQDVGIDLHIGAGIVSEAARRAGTGDAVILDAWARALRETTDPEQRAAVALDEGLAEVAMRYPDRHAACRYPRELVVVVDPPRARFSSWYELFPRSCAPELGRHGTFRDCRAWLSYVAGMGFDVLYLPPIHPIGQTFRKGRNNAVTSTPEDVGSPWAIGSELGGHMSIDPRLGTLDDFRQLVSEARGYDIDIALDIAFQCSPDHPYVREHPEWFRGRPDGTIQYAENPPKKYQDIYPFDFECPAWRSLWEELERVFEYWLGHGVRIFRVDNPHTKALAFWEWVIPRLKARHPDAILLSEAFTRPRLMYRLAKLGFSQSYTYFTWRNTKDELTTYFRELVDTEVHEYFRPNLWPNTPDILHAYLQTGGRPAFFVRGLLAATLGASYGIYGPAFELCENVPREAGSEEYLHSEKYELKHRDLTVPGSLRPFLTRLNAIRRENPALQTDANLRFHDTDNPVILCYSKTTPDRSNVILTVVSLDVTHQQSGWVTLNLDALGLPPAGGYEIVDLLTDRRFMWYGPRNFVLLTPTVEPGHVFRLQAVPR